MIAKGNLHGHGQKLAAYLITGKMDERAELVELRGFAALNIREAFIDVMIQAEATRCERPFFHAHVRLPEGEALTRAQWQQVADRIEQQLGFEGQGRAIAFHYQPNGDTHMHIAWSRIDLEEMKAIDPGLYKNKCKEISRQLERELSLTRVRNERDPDQKTLAPARNEFEQARRLGTDLTAIRETIRACWDRSDSGRSFTAALAEQGFILARGDRRDFVVVDPAGGDHALGKRISGVTAAETRARLADIDKAQLPSVDQAKALQAERTRTMPGPELQKVAPQPEKSAPAIEASPAIAVRAPAAAERVERPKRSATLSQPEPARPTPMAAARDHSMRNPGDAAGRIAGSMAKAIGRFVDFVANMISPPPPMTPDQQERAERVADERDEAFRNYVAEEQSKRFIIDESQRMRQQEQEREQQDRDTRRSRDDRQR